MVGVNASSKGEGQSRFALLARVGVGAMLGAVAAGPGGVFGGALLGALGEVCARQIQAEPTRVRTWLQSFALAGFGGGAIAGGMQEGLSGAALGALVGGMIGGFLGLVFGIVVRSTRWLFRRHASG